MVGGPDRIRAGELLHDLMPKIRGLEAAVKATFENRLAYISDPRDRARQEQLRDDFELELTRIWINIDNLTKREAARLNRATGGDQQAIDSYIALDPHEAKAIDLARTLYRRMRSLTT